MPASERVSGHSAFPHANCRLLPSNPGFTLHQCQSGAAEGCPPRPTSASASPLTAWPRSPAVAAGRSWPNVRPRRRRGERIVCASPGVGGHVGLWRYTITAGGWELQRQTPTKPCNSSTAHDIVRRFAEKSHQDPQKCARSSAGQSAWLRTRRSGVRSPPGVLQYQGFTRIRKAFFYTCSWMSRLSALSSTYRCLWRNCGG
jgi:hypothetical protein